MQAWGGHTYEDYRPIHDFPTRSGIEGLLAACLGIDRDDHAALNALAESFRFAVREDGGMNIRKRKITDFHTIKDARKVDGKTNPYPVVSRREYMFDQKFTLALEAKPQATYTLEQFAQAVQKPCYTPVLGRRSCPLNEPLFFKFQCASDIIAALDATPPHQGTICSETMRKDCFEPPRQVRDRRVYQARREFYPRMLFIYSRSAETE